MSLSLPDAAFGLDDFLARASRRLHAEPPIEIADPFIEGAVLPETMHAAAVLVPIIPRGDTASILLTVRSAELRRNAGQISFPGGRVDPDDASVGEAALREAHEEIGLERGHVTPLGYLDIYLSAAGFRVSPLVGLVSPDAALTLNPAEVAEAFEVPLENLMAGDRFTTDTEHPRGKIRRYSVIHHGERRIWGITAGILRNLYEKLYAP